MKVKSRKGISLILALTMLLVHIMPVTSVLAICSTTSISISFRNNRSDYGIVQYSLDDGAHWDDIIENTEDRPIAVMGDNLRLRLVPNGGCYIDYTGIELRYDGVKVQESLDGLGIGTSEGCIVPDNVQSVNLYMVEFRENEGGDPPPVEFDSLAHVSLTVLGEELENLTQNYDCEIRINVNGNNFNEIERNNIRGSEPVNINGEEKFSRIETINPIDIPYQDVDESKIVIGLRGQWNTFFEHVTINNVSYDNILPKNKQGLINHYEDGDIRVYCEVDKDPDNNYNIVIEGRKQTDEEEILGNFLWDYNEEGYTAPEDKILHGHMEFISAEYDGHVYNTVKEVNEAGSVYNWHDAERKAEYENDWEGVGSATFPVGTMLTVEIIPDSGYQLVSFGVDEGGFEPGEEIGVYTFEIEGGNFHLMATIDHVDDYVNTNEANTIDAGSIAFGGEEEALAIGTARVDIEDIEPGGLTPEQIEGFEAIADGYEIQEYIDISLYNTVFKGTWGDSWDTPINELENDAEITLYLSDDVELDDVIILHEKHDGTYEIIENAEYEIMGNTITIRNDSFSNYAIASRTVTDLENYDVVFHTNGGSGIAQETVPSGETVNRPEDPTRYGYSFEGWYADRKCTEPFDFSTPIIKNTIIFAKWEFNRQDFAEIEIGGDFRGITQADDINSLTVEYVDGNVVNITGQRMISKIVEEEEKNDRYFIYAIGDVTIEAVPTEEYNVDLIEGGQVLGEPIKVYNGLQAGEIYRIDPEFRRKDDNPPPPPGPNPNYPDRAEIEIGGNVIDITEVENEDTATITYNDGNTVVVTGTDLIAIKVEDNDRFRYFIYATGDVTFTAIPEEDFEVDFFEDGQPLGTTIKVYEGLQAEERYRLDADFRHEGEGPHINPDFEDITFNIAWYKTFVNICINGIPVIEESELFGEDSYIYENILVPNGGTTDLNETNEIRLQERFGDYPVDEYIINDVVYNADSENVEIREDGWYITVPGAETYTISAIGNEEAPVPRTIIWANIDADRNADKFDEDMLLEHGRAKVIAVYDEHDEFVEGERDVDPDTGMGWIPVMPGHKVVFEFVPEYGYQLTSVSANGIELEPQDEINSYTFIMPDTNIHFSATFKKVEDIVDASSIKVDSGSIEFEENALIGGSAVLTVNDAELTEEQIARFEGAAENYEISNYLDIDLYNIFYKGKDDDEDIWANKIDELDRDAIITIKLEEGIDGNDIIIVHNVHDGDIYEIIPIESYDPETNTITFITRSFSNYAIASKDTPVYSLEVNLNGGTPGAAEWEVPEELFEGTQFTLEPPADNEIIPPAGMEFDRYEINGVTYDNGTLFTITENLSIKLLWKEIQVPTHTVTFNLNGGTMTSPLTQEVQDGGVATMPETNPTKADSMFIGWYTIKYDSEIGEDIYYAYNFDTPVTKNITIYADYEPVFTVIYDFNGGTRNGQSSYETHSVSYGMNVSKGNLVDDLFEAIVIPPAGKVIDAFLINGERYELNSIYMLGRNTTIKYLWKDAVSLTFNDIPTTSWYYDSVKYVSERGIITGYNETTFGPFDNLKREQLVNILWRIEGKPDASELENNFSDVPDGKWYTDAIKWANANGIVKGYGGTTKFGVGDNIIRQDLAIMLTNYARYKGKYIAPTVTLDKFADKEKVSSYAVDAVRWASENSIISGNANEEGTRTIAPLKNAMRCEAAVMLTRFCENVLNDPL